MTLQSCKILFFAKKVMLIDQIFEKNKIAKNVSTNTIKLFYANNGSKKRLIFKK